MKRIVVVLVLAGLLMTPAAAGAKWLCAAAEFAGWQNDLLNDLCWIEMALSSDYPQDLWDYGNDGGSSGGAEW